MKKNGPNVPNFLDMYNENHGIPRSICLDQAKRLVANQVKNFCNKNKIEIIETPVKDHRDIGLIERLTKQLGIDWHVSKKKNLQKTHFM